MITLGIDAHKRTHTIVAVDAFGRQLGTMSTDATTSADHLAIIRWADRFDADRAGLWRTAAICRGVSSATCWPPANASSGSHRS